MHAILVAEFLQNFQGMIDSIMNLISAVYSIIQPFLFEDGFIFFQVVLGAWALIVVIQFITSFKGG